MFKFVTFDELEQLVNKQFANLQKHGLQNSFVFKFNNVELEASQSWHFNDATNDEGDDDYGGEDGYYSFVIAQDGTASNYVLQARSEDEEIDLIIVLEALSNNTVEIYLQNLVTLDSENCTYTPSSTQTLQEFIISNAIAFLHKYHV